MAQVVPIYTCRYCFESIPPEKAMINVCECKSVVCKDCFEVWNGIRGENNKVCEICGKVWKVKGKKCKCECVRLEFVKYIIALVIIGGLYGIVAIMRN